MYEQLCHHSEEAGHAWRIDDFLSYGRESRLRISHRPKHTSNSDFLTETRLLRLSDIEK